MKRWGRAMAELQAKFTSPSSLPRAPIAGTRSPLSSRVLPQTKVAPHKSHTRGRALLRGKAATYINEGGINVVRVRNPFDGSQVNPGMIIWGKMTSGH